MLHRSLAPFGVCLLLLAVWEAYARSSGLSPLVLPPPSGIARALWQHRAEILPHAFASLGVASLGFTLSVLTAFALSLVLYALPRAEATLMPIFTISQTIPLVALAPLMILWFGFGLLPKVLLVILVTFLPMLVSLISGYREVPRDYLDLMTSLGAGAWVRFRRVVLPSARPSFLAGLRISATYAVVATIFAEYAGARRGLGIYILSAKNNFRADLVLAAVTVSAVLTLGLLALIRLMDHLTSHGPHRRRSVESVLRPADRAKGPACPVPPWASPDRAIGNLAQSRANPADEQARPAGHHRAQGAANV